jgi:hypothetical protein
MVDITRVQEGFVEKESEEEEVEYDENGNPRVDPNRFGPNRHVQPPPKGTGGGNTGHANTDADDKINGDNGASNATTQYPNGITDAHSQKIKKMHNKVYKNPYIL